MILRRRKLAFAVLLVASAIACAGVAAASASGGHLPGFSFMNRRTTVAKLPAPIRYSFGEIPGLKREEGLGPHVRGPVWFGKVERPNATIYAAGSSRWVCATEQSDDEVGGSSSSCTALAGARELGLLNIGSCGKGRPRHFRIAGLVPNGVTGIEIEGAGGKVGRTVPVLDNTIAFTVGRKNISIHGVGDAAAEEIHRDLPLGTAARRPPPGDRGGCSFYTFFEASTEEGAVG